MPYSFPIGYRESACILVPIRVALVPFVAGALRQLEAREAWQSEADYEAAYNAIAEVEAAMMNNCLEELIESNRAIYRLLDAAIYGRLYSEATKTDEYGNVKHYPIPSIPLLPNTQLGSIENSVLRYLIKTHNSLDNGINGREYPGYESSTSMRNQLARIIELLENQGDSGDNTEVVEQLKLILLALA